MAAKELKFDADARAKMQHGIDILANLPCPFSRIQLVS